MNSVISARIDPGRMWPRPGRSPPTISPDSAPSGAAVDSLADVIKHPGGDGIALEHQITAIIGLEYAACE
jgi:hypothetical protein